MEPEADPMVEDNVYSGKRKRSSSADTQPKSDQDQDTKELQNKPRDDSRKASVKTTPKKQRVEAFGSALNPELPGPENLAQEQGLSLLSMPVEFLQHVMSSLDPPSLSRLMRVNKYLHRLLDERQAPVELSSQKMNFHSLSADLIWSHSRKIHRSDMPYPPKGVTELEMFHLVYGHCCQSCGIVPNAPSSKPSTRPWDSGPGPFGVRTIWPFKAKLCANCLRPRLIKESELMQQGLDQPHRGLIPAAFTPSLHYVMSSTLKQIPIPQNLRLTRYYYQPQIDGLLCNAPDPRLTDDAALESWSRYLDTLRQESDTDVVRLETWETSQASTSDMLAVPPHMSSRSSASGSSVYSDNLTRSQLSASSGARRPMAALSSRSGVGSSMFSSSGQHVDTNTSMLPPRSDLLGPTRMLSAGANSLIPPAAGPSDYSRTRSEGGASDFSRLRNDRRVEIQRRCMDFDPPILPGILERLPAFKSYLKTLIPLDEASWETLKPQLLQQRQALEVLGLTGPDSSTNYDIMDTASSWRAVTPGVEYIEEDPREQAFRPIREKLQDFAKEYVHRRYAGGTGLTYNSAPQFAAEVLLYVRQRFYQNQELEDAAFAAHGEQPPEESPSGRRTRKLKLEHMRHVFEDSIKPFTELVRKDLFLCSECDTHGRHFAFEAIIQHYASKHTDNFSRGNAVVHWKSEWPAKPPFHPNPGGDSESVTMGTVSRSITQPPMSNNVLLSGPSVTSANNSVHNASRVPGQYSHPVAGTSWQYRERTGHPHVINKLSEIPATSVPRRYVQVVYDPYPMREEGPALPPRAQHPIYGLPHQVEPHSHRISTSPGFEQSQQQDDHSGWQPQSRTIDRRADPHVYQLETGRPLFQRQYDADPSEIIIDDQNRPYRLQRPPREVLSHQPQPVYEDQPYAQRRPDLRDFHSIPSPHDQNRTTSLSRTQSLRVDRNSPASNVPGSSRSAAEAFLDTFDPLAAQDLEKEHSRPASGAPLTRPLSRIETIPRGVPLDRRSNISQPRSRARTESELDLETPLLNSNTISSDVFSEESRSEFRTAAAPRQSSTTYEEYTRRDDVQGRNAYETPMLSTSRIENFDDRLQRPLQQEQLERYYDGRNPVYTDQRRLGPDPSSPEIRYIDGRPYQVIEQERPYHAPESRTRMTEIRYEYPPSREQQEPTWDPETRRFYIERPAREYVPRARYVEYEQLSDREIVYEDDARYYQRENTRPPPPPPPRDNQRHERR